ncbi:GntR family transcriptional regulator [Salinactinospora qingdaonensis]|uniref:GntR family transcriptional regulator n=1 Tax=Salinactinospora qingdaonensis TaxID=702744 RepID=A0ABP7FZP8_9ACTN
MDLLRYGERRTTYQFVRDTLSRAILTGQVKAGERLVQADLARQLRVSTTPVREALRDLAAEGLIRLDAHRGAVVRELSKDEAEEIYRIRRLLEPEVMQRAVEWISEEEIEQAAEIQARADAEDDPTRWVELNRQFHRVFVQSAHSPRLAGIVEALQGSASMYILAAMLHGGRRLDEANNQHHQILQAVRDRDVEAVREAILNHIHGTVDGVPDLGKE